MATSNVALTIDFWDGEKFIRSYSKFAEEDTEINLDVDPGTTQVRIRVMLS